VRDLVRDLETTEDGALKRRFRRRLVQRDNLVDTSAELLFHVAHFLEEGDLKTQAVLDYLDDAVMVFVHSRRMLREKGHDSGDMVEQNVDEILRVIKNYEVFRGRSWRSDFPARVVERSSA
jgi:hypothetical protein